MKLCKLMLFLEKGNIAYICKKGNKKDPGNYKAGSPILVPSKIMKKMVSLKPNHA